MKLTQIKPNPNNPRLIKDAKFKKLIKSIRTFPDMMEARPIIVDENNMILGGNMRYKALKELKYNDIPDKWVKQVTKFTEKQKKEFVIKDNSSSGENDWNILANEWDIEDLKDWAVDVPDDWEAGESGIDLSNKNKEIDVNDLEKDLDCECPQCGFKFQK